jgi:drug/metabolite transporter (DMT)-like permease
MSLNLTTSNKPLGITLSLLEVICTIIIASLVKLIAGDLSVLMVLFFRYLFCIPLLMITAIQQRKYNALKINSKFGLIIRTLTGIGSFGCLFAALQFIDLSLMTILLQTMPLFVVLLAPIIIKEFVGWFRSFLALFGFIGVMLILNPIEKDWINFGIVLGIFSPFFGAVMTIFVRRLGKTDHPATTALWYNMFAALIFLLVCLIFEIKWPDFNQTLIILTVIGLVSSLQQICLAYSLKFAPASLLAPLRYVSVPIGILVGVFYFNENLSINFFAGTGIIVFSSLIIIRQETKKN